MTEPRPAKVPYRIATERMEVEGTLVYQECPYQIIRTLTAQHLPDLVEVRILVGWKLDVKPDPTGFLFVAEIKPIADPLRQALGKDLILILNMTFFSDTQVPLETKKAVIHGQLARIDFHRKEDESLKKDELERVRTILKKLPPIPEAHLVHLYGDFLPGVASLREVFDGDHAEEVVESIQTPQLALPAPVENPFSLEPGEL